MKALENKREKQEEFPEMSMRQRADIRARKRKKQLRLRWIIMNSIIALCIILGVLVVKAISLNRENTRKEAAKEAAAEKRKMQQSRHRFRQRHQHRHLLEVNDG